LRGFAAAGAQSNVSMSIRRTVWRAATPIRSSS
jgi:hypothetical protein